jgi:methyltransferase
VVSSASLYLAFLVAVGVERLVELALSTRNARRLLARGAVEVARGQVPFMVVLHALFLPSCAVEVLALERPFPGVAGFAALAVALLAQGLRYWAVATLGERWNVRVIALPGAPPVEGGPYRFVRHPNYLAVALELAAIPLVHGAWLTALGFSLLNGAFLAARIPAEEAALGELYARAFDGRPRFLPGGGA